MQVIIDRFQELIHPFKCSFAIPMPTQQEPPRRCPPDLPLELWLEIFQFATYVHRSASIKPLDPFTFKRTSRNVMGANTPATALYTKLALVQVCKGWRQVALPIFYEHIVVRSPSRARSILMVLRGDATTSESPMPPPDRGPGYGWWTRHIEIFTHSRGCGNIGYLQTVFSILGNCPNLRILSGTWIHPLPIEFLNAISKMYGNSLEGLYWNGVPDKIRRNHGLTTAPTLDFLASFKHLRVLDLRHFVVKRTPDARPMECPELRPSLPCVQDLIISSNSSSLSAATQLSLPALLNLTIRTPIPDNADINQLNQFLKVHGSSLRTVDLPLPSPDHELELDSSLLRRTVKHISPDLFLEPGVCPNLTAISFPATSPQLTPHAHPNLRRIGLRGIRADTLYPDRPSSTKSHLLAITPQTYPKLELVQTVGFLVEADVDGLLKDVFIWWVERFEKLGIDFLDGEGVLWAYTDSEECAEGGEVQSGLENVAHAKSEKGDRPEMKTPCDPAPNDRPEAIPTSQVVLN